MAPYAVEPRNHLLAEADDKPGWIWKAWRRSDIDQVDPQAGECLHRAQKDIGERVVGQRYRRADLGGVAAHGFAMAGQG